MCIYPRDRSRGYDGPFKDFVVLGRWATSPSLGTGWSEFLYMLRYLHAELVSCFHGAARYAVAWNTYRIACSQWFSHHLKRLSSCCWRKKAANESSKDLPIPFTRYLGRIKGSNVTVIEDYIWRRLNSILWCYHLSFSGSESVLSKEGNVT